jgi:hypothetical protein
MSSLYVFALADRKARPFRAAGHRIEFVSVDDVYAAVERVDERPAVSEAALRTQHEIVARIAAKVDAMLPARFGSLVDVQELERVVALRRDAIRDAFDLVRGRDQMTVRLFDAGVRAAPPSVVRAGTDAATGTDYLQKRRQAAPMRARPPTVAAITAAVRDIVAAERFEPGEGRVAATVYHLIERAAVDQYTKRLTGLQSTLEPEALRVSGPWPPFAFVPELWT